MPLYAGLFGIGIGLGVGFLVLVRGMGGGGSAPSRDIPRAPRPPTPRVERSTPAAATAGAAAVRHAHDGGVLSSSKGAAADRTARAAGKRPPRPEDPRAASPKKTAPAAGAGKFALDFAKINLDAALRYARENPDDVRGQVYKFETVSRNYPGTPPAERAAEEAGKLRAGRPELFTDEVTVKPYKIPEPDEKRYDCPPRTGRVTIDGRLGEWNELPQECRRPAQIELTASSWTGPADCSFRFALEYDDEYLYVAVDTTDDRFVTAPDTVPWQQDGIEIRIDARPDPQRSFGRGKNEFADIFLIALGPGETPDDMYFFQKENWPEGVRAVCLKTETGFATEAAIPVSYLNEKQGRQWQAFRFNIAVDDHDGAPGDHTEGAQIWWCPDWRRDKNRPGSGTFERRRGLPRIGRRPTRVTIDGRLDDWGEIVAGGTPLAVVSDAGQFANGDKSLWKGPADLSAKIYAAWSERAIYIAAVVTDDSFVEAPAGVHPWECDCFEVFIDGRRREAQSRKELTAGCHQIGVSPARVGGEPNVEVPSKAPFEGLVAASSRTAAGYVIELAIPLSARNFAGRGWKAGRAVKLSFLINDKDDPTAEKREYVFGWSFSEKGANYRDTSAWETLILSE